MTYNLSIDMEFAIVNDLSLVQVSTLAAFMTLPIWAKTVAIDGHVWYQYSEEKMSEDFPLLFGCAKRCYKNIGDLQEMGFVELTKLGRIKYIRFTGRCAAWGKKKEQIRTESPKTDQNLTENGPENSPKTDQRYNNSIIRNSNIDNKESEADPGLFPREENVTKQKKARGTTEPLCLFADSKFHDVDVFAAQFSRPEFAAIDIHYYHDVVADWSASKGARKRDWIATARNIMRGDADKGRLHTISGTGCALSPDAIKYLQDMAD